MKTRSLSTRWLMLAVGVVTMLFAGIIYAWSILNVPLSTELGFAADALALNFTLTMSFFCVGGLLAGKLPRLIGTKLTIAISGIIAGVGIALTSLVPSGGELMLYVTYSLMAGVGIGTAYITILSTVNSWFPDRKGLSTGVLMMGFGASSLILGNLADLLFKTDIGWRGTYVILGISLLCVIVIASFIIDAPDSSIVFPAPKKRQAAKAESFELRDFTTSEMLHRFSFWRAFVCLVCITAVGNSVISFARGLALNVGADAALATTLVGVLAVCNGFGRILTGVVFDRMGRRFTMLAANILTITSAAITLVAVSVSSLPLCIIGLCLTGMSYGSAPTVASSFTVAFYGPKNFASNFGIVNFNLMGASFMATACASLFTATGGYTAPFILLLSLSVVALILNLTLKKP